jgi:hypothetical protein
LGWKRGWRTPLQARRVARKQKDTPRPSSRRLMLSSRSNPFTAEFAGLYSDMSGSRQTNMELFLELLNNYYFLGAAIVSIAVILLLVSVAFVQGREISFWPPKIGTRSQSSWNKGSPSPEKIDKKRIYEKLSIHCGNCGHEISVTNPRPNQYPSEIHVDVSSASRGGTFDYLHTGCPSCKHRQMVSLRYPPDKRAG